MARQIAVVPAGAGAAMDHGRRLGSLEELLRTNEMTLSNVLMRLKDVESGLGQGTKQREAQFSTALAATQRDLAGARQRLDAVENQWRTKVQELDDKLTMQRHSAAHAAEAQGARMGAEIAQLKQALGDLAGELRRVGTTQHSQQAHTDRAAQDANLVMGSVKQQFQQHREELVANQRRVEAALKLIGEEGKEREGLAASVRAAFESSLRAFGDQTVAMLEKEVAQRLQLAQDVVGAFQRLRDELAAAFSKHGENHQRHAAALRSVEDILRAEIRSRMQKTDELAQHLQRIDERSAGDAKTLAQALRDLDGETTKALKDLRDGFAAEYKGSLEQVARRVGELQQSLVAAHAGLKDAAAARDHHDKLFARLSADVPARIDESINALRGEVGEAHQALRGELERLLSDELHRMRAQNAGLLEEQSEEVRALQSHVGGEVAQRIDEVRRSAKADAGKSDRASQESRLAAEAGLAETRRTIADLRAANEDAQRQWAAAAEQMRQELADEREHRRSMEQELARLSGATSAAAAAAAGAGSPRAAAPQTPAAGGDGNLRELEADLHRLRRELAAQLADGREVGQRLRSVETQVRAIDERLSMRPAAPAQPPPDGQLGKEEDRQLRRRVDDAEQLIRDSVRDSARRQQQDADRLREEIADLRRQQRLITDELRGTASTAAAAAAAAGQPGMPPRPLASAAAAPTPTALLRSGELQEGIERAAQLAEAAGETALRTDAAVEEERAERVELRKLLEGQIRDTCVAVELLEKSVRQLEEKQGGAVTAQPRDFDPAPWVAVRDLESALAQERHGRTTEDARLNQCVKTLEELARALRDDIADTAHRTERELRRWTMAYVEEKVHEVAAGVDAEPFAGGGDYGD
eukprot:TRINITY_DN55703_c0_g1_i1.p1 TRINITY_DN55703_c0_g1~~TRINITY_DN55703_c0_g1_i1.p1  ORF type:complete len:872 (+),score=299.82 TRINITY_DN55703_c0_g1_i1:77-2692(+)